MLHLNKILFVVRGGPPQHKDGTTGAGSGNYERDIREEVPHDDSGTVDFGEDKNWDWRPFARAQAVEGYHRKLKEAWRDTITPDQNDALDNYSDDGYRTINAWLRGTRVPKGNSRYAEFSKNLSDSMTPLTEDTIVYRGTNSDVPDIFTDKGFTSTSLNPEVAYDFPEANPTPEKHDLLRIRLPKGIKVAYGINKGEQEIIVHPSAKFRRLGRTPSGKMLNVEYVSQ